MKGLAKRVQAWVEHGLLSQQQATSILAFEEKAPAPSWTLYGIAGVGTVAIITGIISLIAAHWAEFPDGLKLGTYVVMHSALGVTLYLYRDSTTVVREVLLTLFALLFWAGIALTGQIYNLTSDGWQACLFWLILSLPVTLLARSRLINHLWVLGLAAALFMWVLASHEPYLPKTRIFIAFALSYMAAATGLWHHTRVQLPQLLHAALRSWAIGALLAVVSIYASFAWGHQLLPHSYITFEPLASKGYLIIPGLGYACVLAALFFSQPAYSSQFRKAMALMFLALTLFWAIPLCYAVGGNKLAGALLFFVCWCMAGWATVVLGLRRLFDLVTFIIAVRFIFIYFEVFGTLAATGFGLILSGCLIMTVAWIWYHWRDRLAQLIRGGHSS